MWSDQLIKRIRWWLEINGPETSMAVNFEVFGWMALHDGFLYDMKIYLTVALYFPSVGSKQSCFTNPQTLLVLHMNK